MRASTLFILLLFSASLFANKYPRPTISIKINSASIDLGSDCVTGFSLLYELEVSNVVDNCSLYGGALTGDCFSGLLRDGNCNVIGYWQESASANGILSGSVYGHYPPGFGIVPPTARPFTLSFHDFLDESPSLNGIVDTPPAASIVIDPSAASTTCSSLTDVGTPSCSFAEPIPTLGQWGVIIVSFLLCILSIVSLRDSQKSGVEVCK